jgi:hypothetical protein
MPMYHFRLPDGQEHATDNLRQLKKVYPEATIVGRVEIDAAGNSVLAPYRGDQPEESPAAEPVADVVVPSEPKPTSKKAAR